MSWTDVFPVLTDEMVDEYQSNATPAERQELDDFFAVERIINPQEVSHIISVSLFWKNPISHRADSVARNRSTFVDGAMDSISKYDPWHQYAKPLIVGALLLRSNRPDICFRVYLAADLDFLIPDLVAAGCEVHLMISKSIGNNPGVMWRFLAFQEENKLVTLIDANHAEDPEPFVALTEQTVGVGIGFWRIPVWEDLSQKRDLIYRPIAGSHMGCLRPLPTRLLMEALVWQTRTGGIQKFANPPGLKPKMIQGTEWTGHGFDEWFLQAALYPRIAFEGVLTFLPVWANSRLLPLDIEYCTWANPKSELLYQGSIDENPDPVTAWRGPKGSTIEMIPARSQSPIAGHRKEILSRRGKQTRYAVLIFLAGKDDGVANRQMISLLVSSLVKTEFGGDILIWREQGPRVIKGKQSTEVKERLGRWAPALHENHVSPNSLLGDPVLSRYSRVLRLGPGTLACRNVEYLFRNDESTLVVSGMTMAETPVFVFTPAKNLTQDGTGYPIPRVKSLERGAVLVTTAGDGAVNQTTLLCVADKRAEDRLLRVWQAWLAGFMAEEAEVLGPLFSDTRTHIKRASCLNRPD